LLKDGHDLAIGKTGGFHRISFKSNNLEILLLSQVKGWGYYQASSILLRKSKTDQDSTGKWLHLSPRAHLALLEWMKELPEGQEYLMVGIDRGGRISRSSLNSGQVNRIYKRIARNAGLDELVIEGISGHSMRVGAAQDLLNSGASMPIIMQRGRWSKTDTVMRYVEHI
jgi:integrase